MAAPSEPVTWTRLGLNEPDRVCWLCGKQVKLDELRQYHVTVGPPRVVRIACRDCGPVLT